MKTRRWWNVFGILDFVVAIVLGVFSRPGMGLSETASVSTVPVGRFPLAITPGFAVPFLLIIHLVLLMRWRTGF